MSNFITLCFQNDDYNRRKYFSDQQANEGISNGYTFFWA